MKLYAENKWPYVGIMHETYVCKKGNFESIYGDFPPFGFGMSENVSTAERDIHTDRDHRSRTVDDWEN